MNDNQMLTFDEKGRLIEPSSPFLVFSLSWVSYVREIWAFLLRFLICGIVATALSFGLERYAKMQNMSWLMLVGLAVSVGWTVYSIALTRSVRLFTDENGVWMQSGVFPWQKGVTGVQWRDVGQAGYTQGFLSWALRSYDVRVSHRFTTGAELYLRNVCLGNLAVQHINHIMARLQGRVMSN